MKERRRKRKEEKETTGRRPMLPIRMGGTLMVAVCEEEETIGNGMG